LLRLIVNWTWLSGLITGVFLLLVSYRVIPGIKDETSFKNSANFLRVCGLALILVGIFLAVMRLIK
jgi:hypothetical membrane protein